MLLVHFTRDLFPESSAPLGYGLVRLVLDDCPVGVCVVEGVVGPLDPGDEEGDHDVSVGVVEAAVPADEVVVLWTGPLEGEVGGRHFDCCVSCAFDWNGFVCMEIDNFLNGSDIYLFYMYDM